MLPTERLDYSASANGAARRAARFVWVIVNVEEWTSTDDAAHRADSAGRGAPCPTSRTGLARIRQPGRLLAHVGVFDDLAFRPSWRSTARRSPVGAIVRRRDGNGSSATASPEEHAEVANERDDIRRTPRDPRGHRQEPRGWLGPGLTGPGDPTSCRGGLRLCRDCAHRPAHRAEGGPPIVNLPYAGMQRRRDDADPASQGERI